MGLRYVGQEKLLVLRACPRVAPLGWPHGLMGRTKTKIVAFTWVFVKPDGSGWTTTYDSSLMFPESRLEKVVELFYEYAGPWPFDFELLIPEQPKPKRKKP